MTRLTSSARMLRCIHLLARSRVLSTTSTSHRRLKANDVTIFDPKDTDVTFFTRLQMVAMQEGLPLACMHGRCCIHISSRTPFVYYCCFRSNGARGFFLGASLEGYIWDEQLTGSWKTTLITARFSLANN